MKKQLLLFVWSLMITLVACDTQTKEPEIDAVEIEAILLNKTEITLAEGESVHLVPYTLPDGIVNSYTWTSSDTLVAQVDTIGNVEAVGLGTAIITASAYGKSATCKIIVENYIESVKFTNAVLLAVNDTVYGDSIYSIEAVDGTIYKCKMVEAELWALSEGLFVDDNGYFQGDRGVIMEMKAPMYESEDGKTSFCLGRWDVGTDIDMQQCVAATFDKDAYFAAWEQLLIEGGDEEELLDQAAAAIDGPILEMLTKSKGEYYSNILPVAYVNAASIDCDAHPTSGIMMAITGGYIDATLLNGTFGLKTVNAAAKKDTDIQIDDNGELFVVYPFEMDTKEMRYDCGTSAKSAPKYVPLKTCVLMRDHPEMAKRLLEQRKEMELQRRK